MAKANKTYWVLAVAAVAIAIIIYFFWPSSDQAGGSGAAAGSGSASNTDNGTLSNIQNSIGNVTDTIGIGNPLAPPTPLGAPQTGSEPAWMTNVWDWINGTNSNTPAQQAQQAQN